MHNNITNIQNPQGNELEKHEDIEQEFITHFKKVHQGPQIDRLQAIEKIPKNIPKIITEEHNQLLIRPISLQEVESSMRHLKEGKAPGLDGFTSTFFHRFWDLIKDEVWQVMEVSKTNR